MMPDPPDDDKCQVSMCCQTHFTYCPHCKLFVCIKHLNEHYGNYKQEYQSLINDSNQQQILNKQFTEDIQTEQTQLINFFSREIQYYEKVESYFHMKAVQSTVRPQDCAELRLHILKSSQKRLNLKKIMHQIKQLISDYEHQQPNGIIDEPSSPLATVKTEEFIVKPRTNKLSPLAQFSIDYEEIDDDDDDHHSNNNKVDDDDDDDDNDKHQSQKQKSHDHSLNKHSTQSNSNIPNGKNLKITKNSKKKEAIPKTTETPNESMPSEEDTEADDDTDDDHQGSDPDFGRQHDVASSTSHRKKPNASSKPVVNHFQVNTCPFSKNVYGIDLTKHPLRHMPCTRGNISSIYLFTHLRVFHCLTSKASSRLVRHIMFNGSERDCDLFSQSTETLVNILPKSFRGRCPLTKLGAFGLTKFHDIRLCEENQTQENTGLLNHFVVYHCLSYPWANKLCNAMQAGDYDGSRQILFKPNEPIKAKKWLTTQGKLILAKRYSCVRKKRKKLTKTKRNK